MYGRPRKAASRSETNIISFPLADQTGNQSLALLRVTRAVIPRAMSVYQMSRFPLRSSGFVPQPYRRMVTSALGGSHQDFQRCPVACRRAEPGQKGLVRATRFHDHRSSIVGGVEPRDDAGGHVRNLVEHDFGFAFESQPVHIETLPHQSAVFVEDESAGLSGRPGRALTRRLRGNDAHRLRRVDPNRRTARCFRGWCTGGEEEAPSVG